MGGRMEGVPAGILVISGSRGAGYAKNPGILRMDGQEWGVSSCLKNIREARPCCQYRRGSAEMRCPRAVRIARLPNALAPNFEGDYCS
jgi:hypothetical protein